MRQLVPFDQIRDRIVVLRGHRVMLSDDLAEPYGVEPKVLVQAVKRNLARFPDDFLFQLTAEEWRRLRMAKLPTEVTAGVRARPRAGDRAGGS